MKRTMERTMRRKMKRKMTDLSKKNKRRARPKFSNISTLTRPWLRAHPSTHSKPTSDG